MEYSVHPSIYKLFYSKTAHVLYFSLILVRVLLHTDIPLPESLPNPCSVRHLVEHHLDIQGIPRRYFFELLWHFTSSELEKEKFEEFCSPEGQVCFIYHSISIYFCEEISKYIYTVHYVVLFSKGWKVGKVFFKVSGDGTVTFAVRIILKKSSESHGILHPCFCVNPATSSLSFVEDNIALTLTVMLLLSIGRALLLLLQTEEDLPGGLCDIVLSSFLSYRPACCCCFPSSSLCLTLSNSSHCFCVFGRLCLISQVPGPVYHLNTCLTSFLPYNLVHSLLLLHSRFVGLMVLSENIYSHEKWMKMNEWKIWKWFELAQYTIIVWTDFP